MAELPKIVIILGGLIVPALTTEKDLDTEWLELINEAKKLGLSIDEIRNFLKRSF
jgi:DNA-binding transcriptional MerR regulator